MSRLSRLILIALAALCVAASAYLLMPPPQFEAADWSRYGLTDAARQQNRANGMTHSLFRFTEQRRQIPIGQGISLIMLGWALLWLGLRIHPEQARTPPPILKPKPLPQTIQIDKLIVLAGSLFLVLLIAIHHPELNTLNNGALKEVSIRTQFILFGAGVLTIIAGLCGWVSGWRWPIPRPRLHSDRVSDTVWIVGGLTLVALILRLWRLDESIRFAVDELAFMNGARDVHGLPHLGLLTPIADVFPFPRLYPYLITLSSELVGWNFWGLRLPNAIMGALTIPLMYFAGGALFDRKTGLLAALMFVTFPPHLHFSRIALLHIFDLAFALLAFGALGMAWRSGKARYYVLAGVGLALSAYFYEGGRRLFPVIMALWLLGGLLFWRPQRTWRGLALMGLTTFILLLPLYTVIISVYPDDDNRLTRAGLPDGYWDRLLTFPPDGSVFENHITRLQQPFLHLISIPDSSLFYGGSTPMLLVYVVPFFLLGLGYALYHWQTAGGMLLLLWIGLTPLGSTLLEDSGQTARFAPLLPALTLAVAVGLRYVLIELLPPMHPRYQWLILTLVAIWITFGQGAYYFSPHLTTYNEQFRLMKNYPDAEDALLRSLDFPSGTQVVIVSINPYSESYARGFIRFFRNDLTIWTLTPEMLTPEFFETRAINLDYAFFIQPDDYISRAALAEAGLAPPPQFSPYSHLIPESRQLILFYIPSLNG